MPETRINLLREKVFYFSLLIFSIVLPLSEALVSVSVGIICVQMLILTSWKHPSVNLGSIRTVIMIMSVFGIYLLGVLATQDLSFALYELRKVFFWVIIPPSVFLSPRLGTRRFNNLLLVFSSSVLFASFIALLRLLFKEQFQIDGFRDITLISHIRYSFQVVLSIIILSYFFFRKTSALSGKTMKYVLGLVVLWLISFLFILKSVTGILAFIGTLGAFLILFITTIENKTIKITAFLTVLLIIIVPALYVFKVWNDFYDVEELESDKVEKYTVQGNSYSFDFKSKAKENGNWVHAYLCEKELRSEWNKRSEAKYDSIDKHGYAYSTTLIRYMTSKGFRKDSIGVSKLSAEDIKAIENSIANCIYVDKSFSIYPRIYEIIWELDRYISSGDPNFQSVSQRIEFTKASLLLIKKNPWIGIGTGNWRIKYSEAYNEMNSKLKPENRGPSHNQYLNYMVKFGVLGFCYILSMLLIPFFKEGHKRNVVFLLFIISIGIANFADANLESHMGLSFFCFFYCIFLWHSPNDFKSVRF